MNDTQTIEILKSLRLHAMASVYKASLRFAWPVLSIVDTATSCGSPF